MDLILFSGAWTAELKSDAVILTVVVVVVVGYVAAANGSNKLKSNRRKPVLFRQVTQGDVSLAKDAKVLLYYAVLH